jgi:uncharacterized protein DUF1569
MKNWFNADDRTALLARLDHLRSDSERLWGRMTPREVVCHLADTIRIALGDKPGEPFKTPLRIPGISHLAVWVMPWPKAAPTAPQLLPGLGMTDPTEFDSDKRELFELLRRLSESSGPLARSPVFGALSRASWGRLTWRHLDHHLRQFGA